MVRNPNETGPNGGRARRIRRRICFSLAAVAVALFALTGPARAQLTPWGSDSDVLVDLSTLGPAAQRAAGGIQFIPLGQPAYSGDLLLPPPTLPRSRLLVQRPTMARPAPTGERLILKRPSIKPKRSKRRVSRAKRKVAAKRPTVALKPQPKKPTRLAKPAKPTSIPAPPAVKIPKPAALVKSVKASIPKAPGPKAPGPKAPGPKATPAPVKEAKLSKPVPQPPALTPPPQVPAKAEPKPAPAQASKPAPTQQAALPEPAKKKAPAGLTVVSFKAGTTKLGTSEKTRIAGVIAKMKADKGLRLQLLAYAGEPKLSSSRARRLSLSRALTVRSHLIDKGVRSTRMDVRALGNRVAGGAPSRVDLRLTQR